MDTTRNLIDWPSGPRGNRGHRKDRAMKIGLVFLNWLGPDGKSVYNTAKGVNLSIGDFHSGSTFDGNIELDSDQQAELASAIADSFTPVFWVKTG